MRPLLKDMRQFGRYPSPLYNTATFTATGLGVSLHLFWAIKRRSFSA